MDEKWKTINADDVIDSHLLEISNKGRFRRKNPETGEYELCKLYKGNGYLYVAVKRKWGSRGSKSRGLKPVHRLVALAFLTPDREDQDMVVHLDYNHMNNDVGNLMWVNQKELTAHNKKNPKVIEAKKNMPRIITQNKLTETDVIRLKKRLKRSNNPLYKIAKEFGITHTQLNRIRRGENWGHVKVD
tara:strand:+ start:280 stop:840 length:561 start_codon:yes stop_codon:yes gene_type:complete